MSRNLEQLKATHLRRGVVGGHMRMKARVAVGTRSWMGQAGRSSERMRKKSRPRALGSCCSGQAAEGRKSPLRSRHRRLTSCHHCLHRSCCCCSRRHSLSHRMSRHRCCCLHHTCCRCRHSCCCCCRHSCCRRIPRGRHGARNRRHRRSRRGDRLTHGRRRVHDDVLHVGTDRVRRGVSV